MLIKDININPELKKILSKYINKLRPCQEKSIKKGLLDGKSILVCAPTASGKTLVAEIAAMQSILNNKGKALYIVPLRSLALEKYKEFKDKYGKIAKVAMSIGNLDSNEPSLRAYDFIIVTSEKLDSLIRHDATWLRDVYVLIIDEIHLLNDSSRGPTLEMTITLLREMLKDLQIIGLSATIGNAEELAEWLDAELVIDNWRPVRLRKAIAYNHKIMYFDR